tara:strand:+ start:3415 stop:3699 length:285 start_codon:yes stop_codon:yes gene_type:complete
MRDLFLDFCWWVLERLFDLGVAFLDVVLLRGRTTRSRPPLRNSRRKERRAKPKSTVEPQAEVEPPSMPPATRDPRDAPENEWTMPRESGVDHRR